MPGTIWPGWRTAESQFTITEPFVLQPSSSAECPRNSARKSKTRCDSIEPRCAPRTMRRQTVRCSTRRHRRAVISCITAATMGKPGSEDHSSRSQTRKNCPCSPRSLHKRSQVLVLERGGLRQPVRLFAVGEHRTEHERLRHIRRLCGQHDHLRTPQLDHRFRLYRRTQ